MNDRVRLIMHEIEAALGTIYDQHLRGVYLYGSYARGEEDSESDLDVLVILDRFDHYGAEIDRTSHLVSRLSLKDGVSISRVFVAQQNCLTRDILFPTNALEDGISLPLAVTFRDAWGTTRVPLFDR